MHRLLLQGVLRVVLVEILPDRLHHHQVIALVCLLEIDRFRKAEILVDVIEMRPMLLLFVIFDKPVDQ